MRACFARLFCLQSLHPSTDWKPAYWIIVNQRLWIYRSKADYKPTDYIHVRLRPPDILG